MYKLIALALLLGLGPAWADYVNNGISSVPASAMPALTGDCTTAAGTVATTCTKTNNVAFTGASTAAYTSAGSWVPADGSGASLTFTGISASYTQIGNMLFVYGQLTYPSTSNGSNAVISGLPITPANQNYAQQCNISFAGTANANHSQVIKAGNTINIYTSAGTQTTNVQMSTVQINFLCVYPAT